MGAFSDRLVAFEELCEELPVVAVTANALVDANEALAETIGRNAAAHVVIGQVEAFKSLAWDTDENFQNIVLTFQFLAWRMGKLAWELQTPPCPECGLPAHEGRFCPGNWSES